jgi:hypothetical protein
LLLNFGYKLLENVGQHADVLGISRNNMAESMIKYGGICRLAYVIQRDCTAQERVVATKDVKGRDIDDSAHLVRELGNNTAVAFELERWWTGYEDGKLETTLVRSQRISFAFLYLDSPGAPSLLSLHCLFHEQTGTHHGTFRVANDGVDFRVLVDRPDDIVHGLTPDLLVPVRTLAAVLEHPHRIFGVYAVRHMAQAPQVLEIVAMACVKEPVQRPGTKVVLPACRRLNFVSTLTVGKGGQPSLLKLVSQWP